MEEPKTILVTGACGYIGAHVCVELLNSGYSVIGIDNFSNSSISVLSKIKDLTRDNRGSFECYSFDIRWYPVADEIFKKHKIDGVIHLAGLKSVGESIDDPLSYYDTNVGGTLNLLKVMERFNVRNLVFSSSATVYGARKSPISESAPTILSSISSPYGRTKLMGEEMIEDCRNINTASLRYFNPIGSHSSGLIPERPTGKPNNLMPFITDVFYGKRDKLKIFGGDYNTPDGTAVRDYVHVVDLAKGHLLALEELLRYEKTVNCVFGPLKFTINMGSGKGSSVLDVVKAFEKANNVKIPYEIVERRQGDVETLYADCAKAFELLGWKASATLEEMCKIH